MGAKGLTDTSFDEANSGATGNSWPEARPTVFF